MSADASARAQLLVDVLDRLEGTSEPRLHQVLAATVRHLHELVAEVTLTYDEWMSAIRFLTEVGQVSDGVRQEFILLSDTLGVSSLVERIDYDGADGATENTILGPFYVPGAPERAAGTCMLEDHDDGDRIVVRGTVTDPAGTPIADATIDAWQNATHGAYAVQEPGVQHPDNLRGRYRTDLEGRFELRSVRPVPYPIPADGPVGALLRATGRGVMRAGHLHLMVSAAGYKTLVTHLFDAASDHLDDDAVFGVRPSLIRAIHPDDEGELAARFDVVLSPTS